LLGHFLSIARLANGNVVISIAGSGKTRVETSSNLVNWVSTYTNFSPFSVTILPPEASLFYRAVQPENAEQILTQCARVRFTSYCLCPRAAQVENTAGRNRSRQPGKYAGNPQAPLN
jgi:hypothetical protein